LRVSGDPAPPEPPSPETIPTSVGKNEARGRTGARGAALGAMVSCGAVILSLKLEEIVNGPDDVRVGGSEPESATSREVFDRVGDLASPGGHDVSPRDIPGVDKSRQAKITSGEARGDLAHVPLDLDCPGAVLLILLQLDPSTVRQRLEDVR
jgi:hypothetical protein